MKDFYYGGIRKKRQSNSLMDDYEEEKAIKNAKEFSKGITAETIQARLKEIEEKEKTDEIITYVVQAKDNPSGIVRKFFPYMVQDSPEFVAKRNEIMELNGIRDPHKILIGTTIKINITAEEKDKTIRFAEIRKKRSSLPINIFKDAANLAGVVREIKSIQEWASKNGITTETINLQTLSEEDIYRRLFAIQECKEKPEILYMGTHGLYSEREISDMESQEAMLQTGDKNSKTDDGAFTATELKNFRLDGVALSYFGACYTQAKDIENFLYRQDIYESKEIHTPEEEAEYKRLNEKYAPMGRVAIEQGSKESVGGLWKLNDSFTAEFTKLFFEKYHENKRDASKALKETQLHFIRGNVKYMAKYWGAFLYLNKDFSKKGYTENTYDDVIKNILEGDTDVTDTEISRLVQEKKSPYISQLWSAYQEASKEADAYTSFDNVTSNEEERFKYNVFMQNKAFYRTNLLLNIITPPDATKQTQTIKDKLQDKEAVVDIRRKKLSYGETYIALITTKNTPVPIIVEIDKGEEQYRNIYNTYSNSIQFESETKESRKVIHTVLWEKIGIQLSEQNIQKVYISTEGIYQQINIGSIYNPTTKQYIIEKLDIQYLF